MKYSPQDLQQGNILRQKAQSEPANFGTIDGATDPANKKQRMAGQMGERVVSLMNDPNEAARTQQWMGRFGMSNEGMQFNQARMMMANPQPQQEQQ
jgi:hypothetical protein